MQYARISKRNDDEEIEETAHAYFSPCPFCGADCSLNYEESQNETFMSCMNCGRKWSVVCAQGAIWFLRTENPQQKKMYTSSWIVHRGDRSLEGIHPYILLEADYSKIGKEKVVEQGVDRLVWKVQTLLEHFDRYDRLIRGHSCERVKIAFACARMNGPDPGLSVKQVAAITDLLEHEASKCTQRLLAEGSISYEVRPEKGLTGTEAVIMGFLGEPLYQMDELTAERIIKELSK